MEEGCPACPCRCLLPFFELKSKYFHLRLAAVLLLQARLQYHTTLMSLSVICNASFGSTDVICPSCRYLSYTTYSILQSQRGPPPKTTVHCSRLQQTYDTPTCSFFSTRGCISRSCRRRSVLHGKLASVVFIQICRCLCFFLSLFVTSLYMYIYTCTRGSMATSALS